MKPIVLERFKHNKSARQMDSFDLALNQIRRRFGNNLGIFFHHVEKQDSKAVTPHRLGLTQDPRVGYLKNLSRPS